MRKRSVLACILLVVALAALTCLYCNDVVLDCWKCITTGVGRIPNYMVSVANDGSVWGLGRESDEYYVSVGTKKFGHNGTHRLKLEQGDEKFLFDKFYAISKDRAIIGVYISDDNKMIDSFRLFLVNCEGKIEGNVMQETCVGDTTNDRKLSVRMGQFTHYNDTVCFALWKDDRTYVYRMTIKDGDEANLQVMSSFSSEKWRDSVILSDGTVVLSDGTSRLNCYSGQGIYQFSLEVHGSATGLYCADKVFYYQDVSSSTLYHIVLEDGKYVIKEQIPIDEAWSMAAFPGGGILWSDEGEIGLSIDYVEEDGNDILYMSRGNAILVLLLILLAIVIFSCVVIYIMYQKKRNTLLLRAIVVSAILFAMMVAFVKFYVPSRISSAMEEKQQSVVDMISGFGGWILRSSGNSDNLIAGFTEAAVTQGKCWVTLTQYTYIKDGFQVVSSTDSNVSPGIVIRSDPLLLKAKETGAIHGSKETINGEFFVSVSTNGQYLSKAEVSIPQNSIDQKESTNLAVGIILPVIPIVIIPLSFLVLYRLRIREIDKKVVGITAGDMDSNVVIRFGDELEVLSRNMDVVRQMLRENEEKRRNIEGKYLRFIPDQIIQILGVSSLDELSRETVANRKMVIMTVSFQVPTEDISTEELFSTINTVIQRTTFPAVSYGGISFNFNDSGYYVVFSGDDITDALRTALAMKEAVNALNKELHQEGRKPVCLELALDVGMVQMGMVGDELYMVPTVISHCMETNSRMLFLGLALDAGILLTGAIHGPGERKGCRFIGRFRVAGVGVEDLYELYEGDPEGLAKRKEETKDEFDRAIQAFYRGEYSLAKQIFFQLARTGSGRDGALRYYLTLADRFEQSPPEQQFYLEGRL